MNKIELIYKKADDLYPTDSYGLKWFADTYQKDLYGCVTTELSYPRALEILFRRAAKTMWMLNNKGKWWMKPIRAYYRWKYREYTMFGRTLK